jgi:hypothetical protein
MTASRCFYILFLVLVFFAVSTPHAHAQGVDLTPTLCSGPSADGLTPPTDSINTRQRQALAAAGAARINNAKNTAGAFPPPDVNKSQCIDNLLGAYNTFANGMKAFTMPAAIAGVIGSVIAGQIDALLNQTCSAVMGSVTSLGSAASSIARICVPMPSFGLNLGIPNLNLPGCSGSVSVPLLTGTGPWSPPVPGNSYYFQQGK